MERAFEAPPRPRPDQVVGRAELLTRARDHMQRGGSLLLSGPAGIGKSTVLRALAAESAADGRTVLRCSPTASESHLPFLAIVDLIGLVADDLADALPAPQRAALESALTGRRGPAEQRDGLALRLAVLSVLRTLAGRTSVLVVADDLQWMDSASAELLAFAARRFGDLPIRVVAAVRTDADHHDQEERQERYLRAFPQPMTLRVPPLSRPKLSELLSADGRPALSRSVLRDIHRTSGGNPLFALELGRALAERGTPLKPGEPLPVPTSLRTLVLNRLRVLSPGARETLLIASAGARPTMPLLRGAGRPEAEKETAEAAALGLVSWDEDGVVRFAHPLISAALYAEAPPHERRAAHAALGRAASDIIERARHLALANPGKDARVADGLARAAEVARDRGAPAEAAHLGLLAARHTPDEAVRAAVERRLTAAEDALVAGETWLARDTARDVLTDATRPADRVRAWIAVIDSAGHALPEVEDVFPQALRDAGDDPALLSLVRYQLAWRAMLVDGSATAAREEAASAAELAAKAGDRRTELLSLAFQALMETMIGHPDAEQTLDRALEEPQDPQVACDHNGPAYIRFRYLLMSDRLDDARATISWLIREARHRGAVESEVLFLRGLADTDLRAGHCGSAVELARESLRLAQDSGLGESAALVLAALAEAAGGSVEHALALAGDGVRSSDGDGDLMYLSRNLYALGHARLVAGDAHGAVEALRRVRGIEQGMGVTDPARGRWQGDLAEALVRVGELTEAQDVIDTTREPAARLGRASVLAVLDRSEGLLLAAQGDPDSGAALLRSARDRLGALGYRLEAGRAELALAQVERRRRDHTASRAALDEASRIFRQAKARPWQDLATAADVRPVPAAGGAPGAGSGSGSPEPRPLALAELASMEHRVATLVLEGATNREIAASLFISVKTVEATLTRVYRKLGVRSRVDIVRLAARRAG